MAGEFFPRRDAALYGWSASVAARLLTSPEDYPLPAGMAENFAALQAEFASAFRRAASPATATRGIVEAKRQTRALLVTRLRQINNILKPALVRRPELLVNLGLHPRGRGGHSPRRPRPDSAPTLYVESVVGHTARLGLLARNSERRGRPRGVKGAALYWHAGPTAPHALRDWKLLTHTVRTRLTVQFPNKLPPGATVWVVGRWQNPRLECGPTSMPLGFNLPGGLTMPPPRGVRLRGAA